MSCDEFVTTDTELRELLETEPRFQRVYNEDQANRQKIIASISQDTRDTGKKIPRKEAVANFRRYFQKLNPKQIQNMEVYFLLNALEDRRKRFYGSY